MNEKRSEESQLTLISLVIPIYNEQETLPHLIARIHEVTKNWSDSFEVILVNDGSYDRSEKMLLKLVSKDPRFRLVSFTRNFGHQAAISAGLRFVRGQAVVIMDGDLQDPPEVVERFLEKWREGYEVVYGIRTKRKESWIKRSAYALFYRLLRLMSNIAIPLDAGDFCVMDRKVVDALNNQTAESIRFLRGLRAYLGFKHVGLTYERADRFAGKTKYSLRKLAGLALDGFFGFSLFPLRAAYLLGLLCALPGLLLILCCLFFVFFGYSDTGLFSTTHLPQTLLGSGFLFLTGVVLLMVGVLGEYIGRIYVEVKGRPNHVVAYTYPANLTTLLEKEQQISSKDGPQPSLTAPKSVELSS